MTFTQRFKFRCLLLRRSKLLYTSQYFKDIAGQTVYSLCSILSIAIQRYLYTLDRRRGGLACPAGWRGCCRLGGEGSWYISKLLLYRQSVRAPLRNMTASITTQATAISCSCQSIYVYSVLGYIIYFPSGRLTSDLLDTYNQREINRI